MQNMIEQPSLWEPANLVRKPRKPQKAKKATDWAIAVCDRMIFVQERDRQRDGE